MEYPLPGNLYVLLSFTDFRLVKASELKYLFFRALIISQHTVAIGTKCQDFLTAGVVVKHPQLWFAGLVMSRNTAVINARKMTSQGILMLNVGQYPS